MDKEYTLKICLVRHGETEENLAHILQGHLPGTLTENGKNQAIRLREQLNLNQFDIIISSDLKRVTDTVEILLDGGTKIWEKSVLFREIDWGSMIGQKIEEVNFKKLAEDVETREMLYNRAKQAAKELQANYAGKTILVVSHGLFLRSLIANLTNVPIQNLHTSQVFMLIRNRCRIFLHNIRSVGFITIVIGYRLFRCNNEAAFLFSKRTGIDFVSGFFRKFQELILIKESDFGTVKGIYHTKDDDHQGQCY